MASTSVGLKGDLPLRAHPGSLDPCRGTYGDTLEHDTDHGEVDERCGFTGVPLVVAHHAAVSTDPAEGPFDDPALWENHEAVQVRALDDLERPRPGAPDQISHLGPGEATVSDDALDEGKSLTGLTQQRLRPISVLHVGAMNVDAQQQAKRVDERVDLATFQALSCIETHGVGCVGG